MSVSMLRYSRSEVRCRAKFVADSLLNFGFCMCNWQAGTYFAVSVSSSKAPLQSVACRIKLQQRAANLKGLFLPRCVYLSNQCLGSFDSDSSQLAADERTVESDISRTPVTCLRGPCSGASIKFLESPSRHATPCSGIAGSSFERKKFKSW